MARIIDENFEGTGYEESWSETVDTGCTLDEDASIPGTHPPGAGSQCAKAIVLNATANDAWAEQIKTAQNISYCRVYIYVAEEGFADGNIAVIGRIGAAAGVSASISIGQNSGVLQMRFSYYSSGAIQSTAWITISLNTWYRIEWRYDITNLLWAWRIDGITQHSGSLVAATRTPDRMLFGIGGHTGAAQTTVYEDLVVWGDTTWIGAETLSIPVSMHHYNQMRNI